MGGSEKRVTAEVMSRLHINSILVVRSGSSRFIAVSGS